MTNDVFKIFILEDDEWYNKLLTHTAALNPDYLVKSFYSASELYKSLNEKPDVITVDYRLPDASGLEVLKKIKSTLPEAEVIIISEQEDIETAVGLLREGAYDYLVKEKNIRDRLFGTIQKIKEKKQLIDRVEVLEKEVQKKYALPTTIIGNSKPMEEVSELINKAIGNNLTVSVLGETGTGKEVIAKAIHYSSEKKNKPFVAVNVAAIPSELIESELFGHEKGAFTGALTRRIGKFEEAHGGTLFLDEIGEMDLPIQAKLLRVLQEKEVTRIGSNTPVKTDCRIIVATHRNLRDEVKKGRFREDLFFRLYGLTINLPPLRERGKDVLILAKFFLANFSKENNLTEKKLSEEAQRKLMTYHFPGNVRELKSTIELAYVMSNSDIIEAENISLASEDMMTEISRDEMTMRDYELQIIKNYLRKYDDNMKTVAKKLDIGLSTIYRLLKEEKDKQEQ